MKIIIPSKYVKAGVNVKQGDIVKLLDEGKFVPAIGFNGEQVEKLEFQCELPSGEIKIFNMNNSNQKLLIAELGDDSVNWKNKPLEVLIERKLINGVLRNIVSLVPTDKNFTENDIPVIEDNGYEI